jgi:hypothetical protein
MIASVAPTLDDFKRLSSRDQGIAFLRRLAFLFPRGKTFLRKNLALESYGMPDPNALCTGWPQQDLRTGVVHLLGIPWQTIAREGYISEALSGDGFHEVTQDGWLHVEFPNSIFVPDRAVIDALRLLHKDLQGYEHYFREGKLKEAVTAAFLRVENRLNEIRDASKSQALAGVFGVNLPYKLFETGELKFPYATLSPGNTQAQEAYAKHLKGLLASGVGWFRNSFGHEPHNLPNPDAGEALELLFVASYMLRIIDKSV